MDMEMRMDQEIREIFKNIQKLYKDIEKLHKDIKSNFLEKPDNWIQNEIKLFNIIESIEIKISEFEKCIKNKIDKKNKINKINTNEPYYIMIIKEQLRSGIPLIKLTEQEKNLYSHTDNMDYQIKKRILIQRAKKEYASFYNKSTSHCKLKDIALSSAGLNGWAGLVS